MYTCILCDIFAIESNQFNTLDITHALAPLLLVVEYQGYILSVYTKSVVFYTLYMYMYIYIMMRPYIYKGEKDDIRYKEAL